MTNTQDQSKDHQAAPLASDGQGSMPSQAYSTSDFARLVRSARHDGAKSIGLSIEQAEALIAENARLREALENITSHVERMFVVAKDCGLYLGLGKDVNLRESAQEGPMTKELRVLLRESRATLKGQQ
jgi:hypothetical protein